MSEKVITLAAPHPAQEQILTEKKRFNVLACGRRFGKSALANNLLSETAIDGFPAGYFCPTYKLLDGTYQECLFSLDPIVKRKNEHQFIELITGGRIDFWSLENELAGRSRKYKRVVIDEASFTKYLEKRWNESIRPTLTEYKGDGWFMSTPRGKNGFFKFFMRAKQGDKNWMSWQMPTLKNPYIDPEEIDDAKRDLPALAFSQEYLAEFNENVANPFGLPYIQQCTYPMTAGPAVVYAIDLAKYHDWTVIIGLDKQGSVCHFQRFQKDWQGTTREILALPRNVPIIIDSTGVGDPIGEDIARVRSNVELFKFTAHTKQQIMEGLAAAIQQRRITFPEGHITDELSNFEYSFTARGVKYEAPAGLHDDCVCALAMAVNRHNSVKHAGNYSMSFA